MSKKKQFDFIEGLIRKAAAELRPNFEEAAWDKMNALLDDQNKRRRPAGWFWLAGCIFIGGAIYLGVSAILSHKTAGNFKQQAGQLEKKQQSLSTQSANQQSAPYVSGNNAETKLPLLAEQTNSNTQKSPVDLNDTIAEINKNTTVFQANAANRQDALNSDNTLASNKPSLNKRQYKKAHRIAKAKGEIHSNAGLIGSVDELAVANQIEKPDAASKDTAVTNTPGGKPMISTANSVATEATDSTKGKLASQSNTDSNVVAKKTSTKKISGPTKKLYLLALSGTDMGSVKLLSFSNSKIVLKFGLGIGYQFSKNWSIQTGLYISNKKYTAGPKDYRPKTGSYWDGVDIMKVEAACMVYEIPLTVRYNFINKPRTVFYATAGASSYIMKKEDYHYHYMSYGQYHQKYWRYTGNRHFLAEASLGIGIEKKLSPRWSILAEPSVSIPLSGVGDGSVRLFSASFQAGAKWLVF